MKRFFKILGIALVALLFVGTFVYLISKSRNKEILYQEIPVEKTDIRKTTVVTGKIEPRNEVNVKPQINGIISELYKEAGQTVQEGEVIARLKVIPDMSSLSSAESRVRLAEINLAQAQTDYEREKILFDKQLVSADEYDKIVQALAQAKEERAAAQDALEVIRDGVSSTNATGSSTLVRSTITGLILDIFFNTLGVYSLACTLTAFLRRPFITLVMQREEEATGIVPSINSLGAAPFTVYALLTIFTFSAALFIIQAFSLFNPGKLILQILSSTLVTYILVYAVERISVK